MSRGGPNSDRGPVHALQRLAFLTALLLIWEVAARFGPWPRYLFPAPSAVAASLVSLTLDGRLFAAIGRSLWRLARGFGLAMLIGIPLGVFMARLQPVRLLIKPLVMGLQALPSITWLPLALLWFGLSEAAIVFVVVMGSLLAIAISTEDGVNQIPPLLLREAGTLGIRGARFWFGVLIPGALPGILTGLKLGWSFAWRALMAAELLFVSGGLGQLLQIGRELLDTAQVVAVMVAIVAVGMAVDQFLFKGLELRVRRRWGLVMA